MDLVLGRKNMACFLVPRRLLGSSSEEQRNAIISIRVKSGDADLAQGKGLCGV